MIDIKNLSKIKHIYRVYKENDRFHCEKYSVVYINEFGIYFKTGRKNSLDVVKLNNLNEYFEQTIGYYLNKPDISEVNKNLPKIKLENKIKDVKTRLDSAKYNYEYYLNQYNSLMQDYEKLEDKNNVK